MPKRTKRNLPENEHRPERLRILVEIFRASTPAIYCRSWVPYVRLVLLLIILLGILAVARLLLVGSWSW